MKNLLWCLVYTITRLPSASALFLVMLVVWPALCQAGQWRVHFVDVGYGDAIILESPDQEVTLIDAGGREGGAKLKTYLSHNAITTIHRALLTHPHDNHCLGFEQIAPLIVSKELLTNGDANGDDACRQLTGRLGAQGFTMRIVKSGDRLIDSPSGSLHVLHPQALEGGLNENSLVLWLNTGGLDFLFTADIGPTQQQDLMRRHPALANARVVQLPHHGGDLAAGWMEFFSKAHFVASTGPNPYGLPLTSTMNAAGRRISRTDIDGTKVFYDP